MKKLLLPLLSMFLWIQSFAQISITSSDLLTAGDTFRVSNASLIQPIDFVTTGANTNWDFSTLSAVTQELDSSFTLLSTGSLTYGFAFGFGTNAANILKRFDAFAGIPPGTFPIEDIFAFYNKSSSTFKQVGLGATMAGVDIPFTFSDHDFIYHFPIDFGDMDSCNSGGTVSVPATAFVGITRSRHNQVDGWGTITTPYGTFNALRVKSIVNEFDSIYIDSLGTGFGFQQPQMVEYKWLAAGMGIPVLQINTMDLGGGNETVSSVKYLDSIRPVGINEVNLNYQLQVAPNPIVKDAVILLQVQKPMDVKINLLTMYGSEVGELVNQKLNTGNYSFQFCKNDFALAAGVYFIEITTTQGRAVKKIVINN